MICMAFTTCDEAVSVAIVTRPWPKPFEFIVPKSFSGNLVQAEGFSCGGKNLRLINRDVHKPAALF
jgi:hypothetical protein